MSAESSGGCRYMVPQCIAQAAKVKIHEIKTIRTLDLSWKRGLNKITLIENLENCKILEKIILHGNSVTKIIGISHLRRLAHLDLSMNSIKEIGGLPPNITILNLSHNRIKRLPPNLCELKNLTTFRISHNKLHQLVDLRHIRKCISLVNLDYSNNPVCKLEHFFFWTVFTLPSLNILCGDTVSNEHRDQAKNRFERTEYETVVEDLERSREQLTNLQDAIAQLEKKNKNQEKKIKAMYEGFEIRDEEKIQMEKKIDCLENMNNTNNQKLLHLEKVNNQLEEALDRARYFGVGGMNQSDNVPFAVKLMNQYIEQTDLLKQSQAAILDEEKVKELLESELQKLRECSCAISDIEIKLQHTIRARVKKAKDLKHQIKDKERKGLRAPDLVQTLGQLIEDTINLCEEHGKPITFDKLCDDVAHFSHIEHLQTNIGISENQLSSMEDRLQRTIGIADKLSEKIFEQMESFGLGLVEFQNNSLKIIIAQKNKDKELNQIVSPSPTRLGQSLGFSDLLMSQIIGEDSAVKDVMEELQNRITEVNYLRNEGRRKTMESLNQFEKQQLKQLQETRNLYENKIFQIRVERRNILAEIEDKGKELQKLEVMIQKREEELESLKEQQIEQSSANTTVQKSKSSQLRTEDLENSFNIWGSESTFMKSGIFSETNFETTRKEYENLKTEYDILVAQTSDAKNKEKDLEFKINELSLNENYVMKQFEDKSNVVKQNELQIKNLNKEIANLKANEMKNEKKFEKKLSKAVGEVNEKEKALNEYKSTWIEERDAYKKKLNEFENLLQGQLNKGRSVLEQVGKDQLKIDDSFEKRKIRYEQEFVEQETLTEFSVYNKEVQKNQNMYENDKEIQTDFIPQTYKDPYLDEKIKIKKQELEGYDQKITEKLFLLTNLESSLNAKRELHHEIEEKILKSKNIDHTQSSSKSLTNEKQKHLQHKVQSSVGSVLAKFDDFDNYNHTQMHTIHKRLTFLHNIINKLSSKLRVQPNIKYLSETEHRFQHQIVELKKEIGNKLIDLRQLDKKIGRRKQILDTLQEGPLTRSLEYKDQVHKLDKELGKKSLQLRQINHHLNENNRVWRKVKYDLEEYGEYKLRLQEIVEQYETKIRSLKSSTALSAQFRTNALRTIQNNHPYKENHSLDPKYDIKAQSHLSSNLYERRSKYSSPPNPLDVNTGNVVSHISKELENALSTLI